MRRGESGRRRLLGLVTLCILLPVAVVSEATVAIAVGGNDVAEVAKAKGGKVIASPRFDVPGHILAPPRPAGSPTVTYTITGKLVMRGCFTSASSNGRKVKCSGAVLKACVESRTIDVYAPYALIRRQSAPGLTGASPRQLSPAMTTWRWTSQLERRECTASARGSTATPDRTG